VSAGGGLKPNVPRRAYFGFALENVATPEARKEIMTEAPAHLIGS